MNRDAKGPQRRGRRNATSEKRGAELESVTARGRSMREGGNELEEGILAVGRALEEQLRERPYATLAAAAGAGFVLGNALHTRIGRLALMAAGGLAATRFLQGDGAALLEKLLGADVDDEDIDDELEDEIGDGEPAH